MALDLSSVFRLSELGDYIVPFALRVVCDLGVADRLADGPMEVDVLAKAVGAHPQSLRRVLRALATRGVFTEVSTDVFALTPLGQPLRADHPMSLRDTFTLLPSDIHAWAGIEHSVRTGESAFQHVHGVSYWDYLAEHPDESARVDRWVASVNRLHLRSVQSAYPWQTLGTVVDVGGGTGGFLAGLLAKHRHLRGVLFDLQHVVSGAVEVLAAAGVADRCEIVAGSFFDTVPTGGDAYVLKTVLPGFDTAGALTILGRVRDAMGPESRLLLLEAVLPPGDNFDVAKLFDVHTLVLTAGAHRDREEMETLLEQAGLRPVRQIPTPTLTIVEATR